jgi:hypothetical protein
MVLNNTFYCISYLDTQKRYHGSSSREQEHSLAAAENSGLGETIP